MVKSDYSNNGIVLSLSDVSFVSLNDPNMALRLIEFSSTAQKEMMH